MEVRVVFDHRCPGIETRRSFSTQLVLVHILFLCASATSRLCVGSRKRAIYFLPLVCLALSACSESEPQAYRFGLKSTPITLDPRFATDAASTRVNRLLYRQLVDFDEQFKPLPSLAGWSQLSPQHYRFVLGDSGRVFSDGTRLNAEDVAATYEFILEESNGSPHRGTIKHIERARRAV